MEGVLEKKMSESRNITEVANELRRLAAILTPLTNPKVSVVERPDWKHDWIEPEPYALAMWVRLTVIAKMLELQNTPLSQEQMRFIRLELFGGAGSVQDVQFSQKRLGDSAKGIDERLDAELQNARLLFE